MRVTVFAAELPDETLGLRQRLLDFLEPAPQAFRLASAIGKLLLELRDLCVDLGDFLLAGL